MHPSAQKVSQAAESLGLDIAIIEFPQTTRSAQEAADTIGCRVGQIVKTLCFQAGDSPMVILLSGSNRLSTQKLGSIIGISPKSIKRADADAVKIATGFSIGGVPPFGHIRNLPIYIDEDLLEFEEVWAAAGTPYAVFAIKPTELVSACHGVVAELRV